MSEIHGGVGAYVVNALDPAELDEFEAHLAVCPTCSREVVEFCETAAELSLLATVAAPPPSLRASVLSAISEVRVLPPVLPTIDDIAGAPTLGGDPEADQPRDVETAPAAPAAPPPPFDELALRRQRRRTRVLTGLVAAAMVLALALGGVVYGLVQTRQAQVADQAAETQLLAAPDARIYTTSTKNGAQVSFVVSRSLNKALFIAKSLPTTPADKTYQLWTLEGQQALPDNLVAGGGDRKQFLRGGLTDVTGLAVSIENAGGATAPTDIQALTEI